jgi:Ni,Fe-hydrogenase I cytochrome b subunit
MSVYDAFSQGNLDKWKEKRFVRRFKKLILNSYKNIFYFTLLASITGFLVSEAVEFYAIEGVISTKTYIKAILTEVCFIFLSGYRSDNKWQTAAVSILRTCIFCLMLFVITSKTFIDSSKNTGNTNAIVQQIIIVEKQIKEKEKSIIYYRDVKKWPITTKQLIKEKDLLVKKLIDLKDQQAKGANVDVSDLIRYKAYGKAFFRVLLLFISILITRRIFSF